MAKKNDKDKIVRIEAHLTESDADKLTLIAEEQGRSRKNYVEFLLLNQIKNWEKEQ